MATNATLTAKLRNTTGKGAARRMRRDGRIPAVVYGHGEETRSLSIDALELDRLFAHISVENTIIQLDIEEEDEAVSTLVREVQTHPFKSRVLHVDFYQVHAGETLTVVVPIHLTGTAEGVREGGVLQQVLHDVEISCTPANIPESIDIDVTELDVGDSIHAGELPLPEGVAIEIDPARTVCSVVSPTVAALAEEPEVVEGVGGEVEPELIRDRQEEDETPAATEEGGDKGE